MLKAFSDTFIAFLLSFKPTTDPRKLTNLFDIYQTPNSLTSSYTYAAIYWAICYWLVW